MYCTNCGRKLPEDGSPCICGAQNGNFNTQPPQNFQAPPQYYAQLPAEFSGAAAVLRAAARASGHAGTRDVKTVCVVKAVFHVRAAFYGADGRVGGLIGD